MSGVIIRRATVGDARGIGEVHVRSWQTAYRGQMSDEFLDSLDVDQREEMWRRFLKNPESASGTSVFVAEDASRVAGWILVGPSRDDPFSAPGPNADPSVGEIFAINLHPDFFRRGVGRLLMNEGVEQLRLQGFESITLWVLEGNERARAFYEVLGWEPDGATKKGNFGGVELEEVRYRLTFK